MSRQQDRSGMGRHGCSGRPGPPPDLEQFLAQQVNAQRQKPKRVQELFASCWLCCVPGKNEP